MTKEQAIEKLKDVSTWSDTEQAHFKADDILCDLLCELGCEDVVLEFSKIKKWYA